MYYMKEMKNIILSFFIINRFLNAQSFGISFGIWQTTTDNRVVNNFQVYWNVPTFMCHKYGLFFEEVSTHFGIRQNDKDQFRGDEIFILYDPGYFPALLKDKKGKVWRRNGGIPQEGNLTHHLHLFEQHVEEQVYNKSFSGIAVIDFESWRPIFRQNWASLNQYRELSIEIERLKHPFLSNDVIKNLAERNFETYGRKFMDETLKLAKKLRPFAKWGYYAYPYCYNFGPKNPYSTCAQMVNEENDRLYWLFSQQQVLFPSVYLRKNLAESKRVDFIKERVNEAIRVAGNISPKPKVMPYLWYKYQDNSDIFLSKKDIEDGISEIANRGADGLVIWGSSYDLNNRTKCQKLKDYLIDILGPVIYNIKITQEETDITTTTTNYN
ncbi:hyaluronidase B-like [Leptopilina boulardi]|uniref:hyaluronidase B-like n=1 Tax=Leptopilina boulardi TaxID=63433 RepID=UPI0021F5453B|nr:hyaluronidase B-like [Leptopilina boulardi]